MKDIIDVSCYQGTIDWDKLAGKIGGAMLKTVSTNKSFGGIYIDPMFERNYNCIIEEKEPFKRADGMPCWMRPCPGSPLDHFNGDYFAEVNHHVCAV